MVRRETKFTVPGKPGIHARYATQLANAANCFESDIHVGKGERLVDAKSVLNWLSLCADEGTELTVLARGQDAEQALEEILSVFDSCFAVTGVDRYVPSR